LPHFFIKPSSQIATFPMRAQILIALIVIVIVSTVLILWMPSMASIPVSSSISPSATTKSAQRVHASVNGTNLSRQEAPDGDSDPAQLLAQIRKALASSNPEDRKIAFSRLLPALVRVDPLAAASFAETNNEGNSHDLIMHRVAQLWAAQEASAALHWATMLTNATERSGILTDVCLQVAETNPETAVLTHSQYVSDQGQDAGLEALTQRWAERDLPAALNWALSRDEGVPRDELISRVAFVQSQTDPVAAATLAVEKIPPGKAQTEGVMAIVHQWGLRDLTAAKKWAEAFPQGNLRTRALNELNGIAQLPSASQR
jgi:hypothetical protein